MKKDERKTKKELIGELDELRRRIAAGDASVPSGDIRMKTVLDGVVDIVALFDVNCIFKYVTPSVKKVLGYEMGDLIGKSGFDYIHPDDREPVVLSFMNALEIKKEEEEAAFRFLHADGRYLWFEAAGRAVIEEGRETVIVVGCREITHRRMAEEALRASEAKQRFLTDRMSDVVWTVGLDMRATYISPSVGRALGFTVEECLARDVRELITPASMFVVESVMRQVLEEEKEQGVDPERAETLELEFHHKDGSTRWLESVVKIIRDEKGKLSGFHGVSRDITERNRVMEALRDSEQKYSALVEQAMDSIVVVQEGLFRFVNRRLIEDSGYSEQELIGRNFLDMVHRDDHEAMIRRYSERMAGMHTTTPMQFRVIFKDGRVRCMESLGALIQYEGKPALFAFLRDVTERKRSEARLESINRCLLGLGPDHQKNVDSLVALCGEIFGVDMALYSRLEGSVIRRISAWNYPGGMPECVPVDGSLCGLVILQKEGDYLGLGRLGGSELADRIPMIRGLGVKTYFGHLVRVEGRKQGVLCGLSSRDMDFSEEDRRAYGIIASALGAEESRRSIQEAIRKEKEFAESIIETAQAIVLILDREGRIVFFNPYMEEISGWRLEEVRGREWVSAFLPPEDRESIALLLDRAMKGERVRGNINPIITRDGRRRDIEWHEKELRDADGHITGTLSMGQDITERRKLEALWRKSEFIVDSANELMTLISRDYIYEAANESYCRVLGKRRDEVVGRSVGSVWGEERFSTVIKEKIDNCLSGKQVTETDWITFPGKERRYFNINYYPYRSPEGRVTHAVVVSHDITERRLAEEALRRSEEKFYKAFRFSPDAIMIVRVRDGAIAEINEGFSVISGYAREEVLGRNANELNLWASAQDKRKCLDALQSRGSVSEQEFMFRSKSGKVLDCLFSSELIYLGEEAHYLIIVRDISERKNAEEKLRRAEEKYRSIVESAQEGICQIDREGCFIMANQAMANMLGYGSPEELTVDGAVKASRLYVSPGANNALLQLIGKWGSVKGFETQFYRRDGKPIWVSINMHSVSDAAGRLRHYEGIFEDITERRHLENNLVSSEKRYRNLVDSSLMSVFRCRDDGTITFANQAMAKMLSYKSTEELISVNALSLFKSPAAGRALLEELHKNGQVRNFELEMMTRPGDIRHVLLNSNLDGDYITGTILDITERKLNEQILRAQSEKLKKLSSKLTDAEEAERKRVAGELHDNLGQNLTALGINVSIIRSFISPGTQEKLLQRVDDSLVLIERITEFTRTLMSDLRPPVMDDYGLMASVRWYGELFSRRTGIDLTVSGEDIVPRPKMETEIAIFRIIQEALNNVSKHAKANRVTVSGEVSDNNMRFTVVDDGIGFNARRFFRAEERHSWGIASMDERSRSIGGSLSVISGPGKGTKIVIEVPI